MSKPSVTLDGNRVRIDSGAGRISRGLRRRRLRKSFSKRLRMRQTVRPA
jgi:hypothetical protein